MFTPDSKTLGGVTRKRRAGRLPAHRSRRAAQQPAGGSLERSDSPSGREYMPPCEMRLYSTSRRMVLCVPSARLVSPPKERIPLGWTSEERRWRRSGLLCLDRDCWTCLPTSSHSFDPNFYIGVAISYAPDATHTRVSALPYVHRLTCLINTMWRTMGQMI